MKQRIQRVSEDELEKDYPVKSKAAGWHFRVSEVSSGAWEIEGKDYWGRKLSFRGSDPDELLLQAEREAELVNQHHQS